MAFIAIPAIAAVTKIAVTTAVVYGLSTVARLIAPEPKAGKSGPSGAELSTTRDTNALRQAILGEAAVAGSLVDEFAFGGDNETLVNVIALADHQCDSLRGVFVDGVYRNIDAAGRVESFGDNMTVTFHDGGPGQVADTGLIAQSAGRWSADDKGTGVCYVVVRMKYDEEVFPGARPELRFVVRGARLYDWRFDNTRGGVGAQRFDDPATWDWSDNATVCLVNYMLGIRSNGTVIVGPSFIAPDDIDFVAATAAANACDETIGLETGGTEKRYRVTAVIAADQQYGQAIEGLKQAMAGRIQESAGFYTIYAGVAQATVTDIVDDDLMADQPFRVRRRKSSADLVNAVTGSYTSVVKNYTETAYPPRTSSADEIEDGGNRYLRDYDLLYVPSGGQAQRVSEIFRRTERQQGSYSFTLRARFSVLEAGDWVRWTSARYGFVNKTFLVARVQVNRDRTTVVDLQEITSSIYTWVPADDEITEDDTVDLPTGAPPFDQVEGLDVAAISITSGELAKPAIHLTWTPVSDPTVTALVIEYRIAGEVIVLSDRTELPQSGVHTIIAGIQADTIYEARALPVTVPQRAVSFTPWRSTGALTPTEVVPSSIDATVGEGSVGLTHLDARAAFEIRRAERLEGVLSGASNEALAASLIDQVGTIFQRYRERELAALESTQGEIRIIEEAKIRDLAVGTVSEGVEAIRAQYTIAIDLNGYVTGIGIVGDLIDGEPTSRVVVVADRFLVAKPGEAGGDPKQIFGIAEVNGVPTVAIKGDLIADGSVEARSLVAETLSAISADLGEVTTGRLNSPDGKFVIDLDNKTLKIEV